jgi:energy-converting hydrogenase Eha subunit C
MMKMNVILEWTATVVTVLGAVATALAYDPLNIYLLNVGSILWLIWAVRVKKLSLVIVNAGLLTVYAYGFVLRML